MNFIEVIDSSNGRSISLLLSSIEIFYPIVKFERGDSNYILEEVACGTEILLKSGRKIETSMLYVEFKERVLIS